MAGTRRGLARLLTGTVVLGLFACSGNRSSAPADQIVAQALAAIEPFHVVKLDTAAIAAAVRAGRPVQLPFVTQDNRLTAVEVRLTLRNLRAPALAGVDVKNGVANTYRILPLPPPATYQGRVEGKSSAAILTVDERVVEGNILLAPGGWSIIEPLEPLLRLRGVEAERRKAVLQQFDHIVYNVRNQHGHVAADADLFKNPVPVRRAPMPAMPLVVSTVADGDAAFYRAYPPDSVMPFWLKEETLFNALDWLFHCLEPKANSDNAYAVCDNAFDGGHEGFDARVRLDRLEAWEAGGPSSTARETLLRQSAGATHQAAPPCCGPPHTAGRSSLVFFFSGRTLEPGAGVASVAGLAVYGESCFSESDFLCHHALSQVTPSEHFPGNAFFQELLVAHEVGHLLGGAEQPLPFGVCWLFGQQCGPNLMGSIAFSGNAIYLYTEEDTRYVMGPLMRERLGREGPAGKPADPLP